jgi:3-hydroxymyristoyl/3-hydroxydecanoyl-(acyl carrier protein) dehydratase
VEEAAIVVDPTPNGGGRLLALVTPASVEGNAVRAALLLKHDPLVVPRRIVAGFEIPRTAAGKPSVEEIVRFLAPPRDDLTAIPVASGGDKRVGTELRAVSRYADGRVAFQLLIPHSSIFFDGHFPEWPVLPAVVQLQKIVVRLIRTGFGEAGVLQGFDRLKFRRPIRPGAVLLADFTRRTSPRGLTTRDYTFVLQLHDATCGEGCVSFGDAPLSSPTSEAP